MMVCLLKELLFQRWAGNAYMYRIVFLKVGVYTNSGSGVGLYIIDLEKVAAL